MFTSRKLASRTVNLANEERRTNLQKQKLAPYNLEAKQKTSCALTYKMNKKRKKKKKNWTIKGSSSDCNIACVLLASHSPC